jgi:O-antigen ligase
MVRTLVEIPRWLLAASLIFAPWAYGTTQPWALRALSFLLAAILFLWLAGCRARRRWPPVEWMNLAPMLALMFQGWWMVLNAHSSFDADLDALLPVTPLIPGAPGSSEGPTSAAAMFLVTGLLAVFLFCCDLSDDAVWPKRIWITMVLTGFSIAAFGVVQKIGGAPLLALVWESAKQDLTDNFATFRYRGNAGAYLNLIFPLLAGFTYLSFRRTGRPLRKAFWAVALFVLLLGIQLNPSRASWFIAVVLALVIGARIVRSNNSRQDDLGSRPLITLGVAVLLAVVALGTICFLGDWETSWHRLALVGFDPSGRSPIEIYLRMARDSGVMGFGPGTFSAVFPAYQQSYDFGGRAVPFFWTNGFFAHAHEDYLETLIDWGWLGTLSWSVLVAGALARGIRRYLRESASSSQQWLLFGSLVALGGVLAHAIIDFPLQIPAIELYVFVLLGFCRGSGHHEVARQGAIP